MALNPDVVESITIANLKTVAEQPSVFSNMMLANSVFNQNMSQQNALSSQNALEIARLGAVKSIVEFNPIDASQARATQHALTGDSVAMQMQSLLASLNSGTQGVKAAINTPPVQV